MENNSNSNCGQQGDNAKQSKKYPGYVPDKSAENNNAEFFQDNPNFSDDYKDTALAEKGPVRNPNYHDLNDDSEIPNSSSGENSATDKKTLEDYNHTNPKRDINGKNQTEDTH